MKGVWCLMLMIIVIGSLHGYSILQGTWELPGTRVQGMKGKVIHSTAARLLLQPPLLALPFHRHAPFFIMETWSRLIYQPAPSPDYEGRWRRRRWRSHMLLRQRHVDQCVRYSIVWLMETIKTNVHFSSSPTILDNTQVVQGFLHMWVSDLPHLGIDRTTAAGLIAVGKEKG